MRTITIIIISTLSVTIARAQNLKESDVPTVVKESFKKEFPNAKAKEWEKEDGTYEVEFNNNKVETTAVFDASGKLQETEQEITVKTLPKVIGEYITKNHAGYKIAEASIITEKSTGKVSYEAGIKKGKEEWDLIFDDKGNFIRKEEEGKDQDKD